MRFAIYEENLERLTKKLNTIKHKCQAHGYPFMYKEVGEEFREVPVDPEDPNSDTRVLRYVLIEAQGIVKHNDWEFVAVVAHEDAGNVVRAMRHNIEIPDRYHHTSPICEHCNTSRRRKDTYLVYNNITNEFKQVGKSCLAEFTNGLDAELVASYIACFDQLIAGEAPSTSARFEDYQDTRTVLKYALETVKHFGYQSRNDVEYGHAELTTASRCLDYLSIVKGSRRYMSSAELAKREAEMAAVKFNAETEEIGKLADDAINYVLEYDESNSYMNNLKVICASEYCASRNLGILVSLGYTYMKHLEQIAEKERRAKQTADEAAGSQFVGSEGDRISFIAVDVKCVYTREDQFGMSFMYKMHDEHGNVIMWSTGKWLDTDLKHSVTGTVKKHEEFNGVKQTWVTRCKTSEIHYTSEGNHAAGTFNLDEVMSVFDN